MKKIGIVNQRYGLEVNGGSEYYTRLIAERLSEEYDVHIITTKAIDHFDWKNYYVEDEETINGVKVHRFAVGEPRNMHQFAKETAAILNNRNRTMKDESNWVDMQGPLCPKLITYLLEKKEEYDVFIFVTYLYYHSVKGLPLLADKAIFIPTAHDEPYINFEIYKKLFKEPRAIIYLTEEEKKLVEDKFSNEKIYSDILGVGIDISNVDSELNFKEKHGLDKYVIYVGRIETGKNAHILFKYFIEYKKRNKNNVKLVLMGKANMKIPDSKDILNLGFVSEEEKFAGIKEAEVLIMPSEYESLSMVVLEAMALNVPVIVNEKCEVLKAHCVKSNAGLYYNNFMEFEGTINYIMENRQVYDKMKENAKNYVDENYSWDEIMRRFKIVIEYVGN